MTRFNVEEMVREEVKSAMNGRGHKPSSEADRPARIKPISVGQLIDENPDLRPVVIDGLLREGETCNLIAAAKVGKSFLAGNLAWAVAAGRHWLGRDVARGRVLIIDNELHPETLSHRLYKIALAMEVDPVEFGQMIDVIPLRGLNCDVHRLGSMLEEIERGTYRLVILDALYRAIPQGTSENDNAQMMELYNRLDFYASAWGSAVVVVHHASKGYQGGKSVTDVGAGAGSISRAADTHLIVRPHEEDHLSVLDAATRSFPSPEPQSVKYEYPLWQAVATEAVVKRLGANREERQAKDDAEADEIVAAAFEVNKTLSESQIVRSTGMGPSRVTRAVGRAVAAGKLQPRRVRRNGRRVSIYSLTATATATAES